MSKLLDIAPIYFVFGLILFRQFISTWHQKYAKLHRFQYFFCYQKETEKKEDNKKLF